MLGERPVVLLRQERPLRVERLVAVPSVGGGDDRVDDDPTAGFVVAGGVAPEDAGQLLGGVTHAAQRPEVVHVQRRGDDLDPGPPGCDLGDRDVLQLEPRERIGRVLGDGDCGEHAPTLGTGSWDGPARVPPDGTSR